ncbi:pyrroloquinoline quinone biosynthesis protein PqqF [Pantoea sp. MBD-2R]|uniref:pyrroloquinoline quinone biosynthesis protein PqqF n=1 Tax=Pantoea sp. MBD-2R TaxID=3141540 RepID=UPI0031834DAE
MSAAQHLPLTLENGLKIHLIHDPQATRAAALIQLAAGTHDEAPRWPGLAHLLEHVLFAGSENFQNEQRLMAWGPTEGARLNATTLACSTAWFFEIAPEKLEAGLQRLVDMLANPLLSAESVATEAAAIEAEYRMLCSHRPTLCEAALSQAFCAPHALHAFHVGNQASFGNDIALLQQALKDYHQRFFCGAALELWLSGPQPLETLHALASQWGSVFRHHNAFTRSPAPPLQPASCRTFSLQHSGMEQLQLHFLLSEPDASLLSVLRELLTDKAEGSLLAALREAGLCDDVTLLEPYRSRRQSVLSVAFLLSESGLEQCAATEAIFKHWLERLRLLTADQLMHYATLSRRSFNQLSPMQQLREWAFGFPPENAPPLTLRWQRLLAQLRADNMGRLWVSPDATAPATSVQGFALHSAAINWPTLPETPPPALAFHTPGAALTLPVLPPTQSALRRLPAVGETVLLLNPLPGCLSGHQAAVIEAALQPVMGECRHRGGELRFSRQQGIWLLQLSGNGDLLLASAEAMLNTLNEPGASAIAQGKRQHHQAQQQLYSDIAIRCLLARLPDLLTSETEPQAPASQSPHLANDPAYESLHGLRWQGGLYGGDVGLHLALARLLSRLPGQIIAQPQQAKRFPSHACSFPTESRDAAVLVFCPVPDADSFAAWRLLAALFEPRFFQQLRVEQNIGYVVSCRFHHTAGQAGILFALQSPALTTEQLFQHIEAFVCGMREVIAQITVAEIATIAASLQAELPSSLPENVSQITEHWLHQQLAVQPLMQEMYVPLLPSRLQMAYQQLITDSSTTWRLSNSALIAQ